MFYDIYSSLCLKKGESANRVAARLGIASGTVSEWKNGRVPQNRTLQKIANYFDVSTDYLLGKSDIKEKAPDQGDQVQDKNVVRIAGRDGTYIERRLTDEQIAALELIIQQMPEVHDL